MKLQSLYCYPLFNTIFLPQSEKNKQLVVDLTDLFNNNRQEEAMQYFSADLLNKGRLDETMYSWSMHDDILRTFPDVQTKIIDIWANEDWVISVCQYTGTHKGVASLAHHGGLLIGKSPTYRQFKVQHIRMYKIKKSKIVEQKIVRDDIEMYQQLGLLKVPISFSEYF